VVRARACAYFLFPALSSFLRASGSGWRDSGGGAVERHDLARALEQLEWPRRVFYSFFGG